VGSPL
jgi:hypothetical protein